MKPIRKSGARGQGSGLKGRGSAVGAPLAICLCLLTCSTLAGQWKPPTGSGLATRWAKDVSPDNVHAEYPRPQMCRQDWLNLNGLWEYAILAKDVDCPDSFDGQILVPFPVESALSGVMKPVGPENRLWYRRTFEIPAKWSGKNVLLHFGAVDWEATVWVNGEELGTHRGGYDPFSFDITGALKDSGRQEIVLSVWDPTDAGSQPRGKQVRKPNGIWYTAVTGIWQTVWLEPVPQIHIESLKITADVDGQAVEVLANVSAAVGDFDLKVAVFDGSKQVCQGQVIKISGGTSSVARPSVKLPVKDARIWTPDEPFLYDLKVTLAQNEKVVDEVTSYFGMRKISLGKDEAGVTRLLLNNKPLFQYGPLD